MEITSNCYLSPFIMMTINLFRRVPEVLENYQRKFQYIHVDEYQDSATRC
nr:UvrD-helicase domain-containing protein [Bacillus tuaregi]